MRDSVIRAATPDDLPACAKIINDWIDETDWMPRTASREKINEAFEPAILDKRVMLVATEKDAVLGYLSLETEVDHIHGFYLTPDARGQGIGRALLDEIKQDRPAITLSVFQANQDALRFYEREGFSEIKRTDGDNEEGLPDFVLRWEVGGAW